MGIIAKFYCNQENGWPETAKLFKQLYATELEPLFITPHYLRNLFSVPNKVMASAVKYVFDERREACQRQTKPRKFTKLSMCCHKQSFLECMDHCVHKRSVFLPLNMHLLTPKNIMFTNTMFDVCVVIAFMNTMIMEQQK